MRDLSMKGLSMRELRDMMRGSGSTSGENRCIWGGTGEE